MVNVSSVLGRSPLAGTGVYSASKFGLEAVLDARRMELASFGVRVVLKAPSPIDTPLYRRVAAIVIGYDQALQPSAPAGRRGSGSAIGC